jgi:hypothetical protein
VVPFQELVLPIEYAGKADSTTRYVDDEYLNTLFTEPVSVGYGSFTVTTTNGTGSPNKIRSAYVYSYSGDGLVAVGFHHSTNRVIWMVRSLNAFTRTLRYYHKSSGGTIEEVFAQTPSITETVYDAEYTAVIDGVEYGYAADGINSYEQGFYGIVPESYERNASIDWGFNEIGGSLLRLLINGGLESGSETIPVQWASKYEQRTLEAQFEVMSSARPKDINRVGTGGGKF